MSLCLLAIFKNESHILEEFIKHYTREGVDHFFLIDNGSNDDYLEILSDFENISLVVDPSRPFQVEHYNNYFLEPTKKYDWVIVCDLDEFIYSRLQFKTIKEYLNSLRDEISQVFIPWKIFGSAGFDSLDNPQPDYIVDNFTKRTNYDKQSKCQGVLEIGQDKYSFAKTIVRTKYLKKFNIHSHETTNENYIGADNNDYIHPNKCFYKLNEDILSKSFLHLNHYAIQSYEWFMRIKATRGDVMTHYIRNEQYFREFDAISNDKDDFELKWLNEYL